MSKGESVLRPVKEHVFTAALSLTGLKSLLIFTAGAMGTPLPGPRLKVGQPRVGLGLFSSSG